MSVRRLAVVSLAIASVLPGAPAPRPLQAQAQNPCVAAVAADGIVPMRASAPRPPKYGAFGADTRDVRDLLHESGIASAARARTAAAATARPAADRDENHIAILEDHGDLIVRPNRFDLANTGLRFEPAGDGYTVTATGGEFRGELGSGLVLEDDDSVSRPIGFPFEFYGRRATSVFVNSDGNLTFEQGDNGSTERGLQRLTAGAPRIAPFFADLDPSAGGRVFLDATADAMTITWCAVPGFGVEETMTAQAVLFPSGSIEFRFGAPDLGDGIVALSPGRGASMTAVDLNRDGGAGSGPAAIGERFIASPSLDLVAASRRFYESHPDQFDQLVFWADTTVVTDAFAFESTVQNAITGTGLDVFDFSAQLGSAGALQSVINMDRISKYPDTPSARLFGPYSTLGVLAHETGHRWLARLMFTNADRVVSDQLLGRQRAHWSFFLDTDGSVMEGNEIEDLGGGSFRTVSTSEKYSRLDQYAMGLVGPDEVLGWFYVDAPISDRDREDSPVAGISLTGTRRDVLIQHVIEALGPRVPAAADAPRTFRQAFVFVRRDTAAADPLDLTRLGRIREQFGAFFSRATENRMAVQTALH